MVYHFSYQGELLKVTKVTAGTSQNKTIFCQLTGKPICPTSMEFYQDEHGRYFSARALSSKLRLQTVYATVANRNCLHPYYSLFVARKYQSEDQAKIPHAEVSIQQGYLLWKDSTFYATDKRIYWEWKEALSDFTRLLPILEEFTQMCLF